jgi:hypothetical protein
MHSDCRITDEASSTTAKLIDDSLLVLAENANLGVMPPLRSASDPLKTLSPAGYRCEGILIDRRI